MIKKPYDGANFLFLGHQLCPKMDSTLPICPRQDADAPPASLDGRIELVKSNERWPYAEGHGYAFIFTNSPKPVLGHLYYYG
jgi:hypothetical protein